MVFKCDGFALLLFGMVSDEEKFCIYLWFFSVTLSLVGLF